MTGVQIGVCVWLIVLFTSVSIFGAWMAEKSRSDGSAWKGLCYGGIFGAGGTTLLFLMALFACGGIE